MLHEHNCTKFFINKADVKSLAGPVYDVLHDHAFKQILHHVEGLKTLTGPVYDIESNHNYQEVKNHQSLHYPRQSNMSDGLGFISYRSSRTVVAESVRTIDTHSKKRAKALC